MLINTLDTTNTIGIIDDYSVSEYLESLLDEELYSLVKVGYNKEIKEILKNFEFKKLFEKVKKYSHNIDTTFIIYCETLYYIEKEICKRWIKYVEKRRVT